MPCLMKISYLDLMSCCENCMFGYNFLLLKEMKSGWIQFNCVQNENKAPANMRQMPCVEHF